MKFLRVSTLILLLFTLIALQTGCSKKVVTSDKNTETSTSVKDGTTDSKLNEKIVKMYKENTKNLILITPKEFKKLVKKNTEDEIFVYFGRVTCSYCRNFVPLLNEKKSSNLTIYYIDTENTDKNQEIKDIRNEYGVDLVPSLVKVTRDTCAKFDIEGGDLDTFLN